jgi:hypothetical protein
MYKHTKGSGKYSRKAFLEIVLHFYRFTRKSECSKIDGVGITLKELTWCDIMVRLVLLGQKDVERANPAVSELYILN